MLLLPLLKEMITEFIFGISKDEAINITKNSSLNEKIGSLKLFLNINDEWNNLLSRK